jgi:predicted DNA-binding transcriptional regulator AlpA
MDRAVETLSEWCQSHRVSRSSFYNLVKRDEAPRTFRVGNKILISKEASAEWRRKREQADAKLEEAE